MDPVNPRSYDEQIAALTARTYRLEEVLRHHGLLPPLEPAITQHQAASPVASAETYPRETTAPGELAAVQSAQEIPTEPGFPASPTSLFNAMSTGKDDGRSLESQIGSHWFNRIGILAVLIAAAWFLKLAIDSHWIGPLGRVMIGLLAGAALIAWSERFRSRGYTGFSYSLKAVGSGVLYLSLWAAFSLFHLIPSGAAFVAMIAVTAFNGYMAWMQDSELLALYSIVGALSTPLLVSTGENHEITLFSYLLLLDIAVLILVLLRPWSRLLFMAFCGTALLVGGWSTEYYSTSQFSRTAVFVSCFCLIFAFAPRLVRPAAEGTAEGRSYSGWDTLALLLMPVVNAGLGFIAFYAMCDDAGADWAKPWVAVIFATFYLALLRLPANGILRENPASLSALHLTTAVVFLTVAIPLKAHGRWLTIGWLVQGAALIWAASRIGSKLLRALALLCAILGLIALVTVNPLASTPLFFNQRFGTYCVAIAASVFIGWVAMQARAVNLSEETPGWPEIAGAAVLATNALILLALGWEIHSYWWNLRWHGESQFYRNYQMYAQFTYSALFMAFGAVLLTAGFWRRSAFVRWQALVLLAAAIGKVFLLDVSQLSQGYRILSFLGLGALLLAVSFVYQRDWLNLRNVQRDQEESTS
ncbi:MAG TPA: DUF2339 domain-containing protein [Acidobacteriaceae bacterium]|jgi:uncharacterized membrane protein|nr:DUF2339 domain-containing protein [Acidobacteriaceae bacterium]